MAKTAQNLQGERFFQILMILILTIALAVNSGKPCYGDFNPREFLIEITILYFVDVVLLSFQLSYLKKN